MKPLPGEYLQVPSPDCFFPKWFKVQILAPLQVSWTAESDHFKLICKHIHHFYSNLARDHMSRNMSKPVWRLQKHEKDFHRMAWFSVNKEVIKCNSYIGLELLLLSKIRGYVQALVLLHDVSNICHINFVPRFGLTIPDKQISYTSNNFTPRRKI